jgi:hypothetical protein
MNEHVSDAGIADLLVIAAEEGYTDAQLKGDAGVCAIARFLYTHAIVSDLSRWGYEGRWCYRTYEAARAALAAWDGKDGTEPAGWHKDTVTGRGIDEGGKKYGPW